MAGTGILPPDGLSAWRLYISASGRLRPLSRVLSGPPISWFGSAPRTDREQRQDRLAPEAQGDRIVPSQKTGDHDWNRPLPAGADSRRLQQDRRHDGFD